MEMMEKRIFTLSDKTNLKRCYPIMKELRPHLTYEDYIYIDDLVTSEKVRSKGLGAELLKFAEDIARNNGCKSLRLCTGVENERGVKFYDRNGWIKRAFAFTKKLKL